MAPVGQGGKEVFCRAGLLLMGSCEFLYLPEVPEVKNAAGKGLDARAGGLA